MTHEEKKVAKIIEELTMYFFSIGADKIGSGIERMEDGMVKITFHSNYKEKYAYSIETLEKCLNEPKNEAIEDIYWELAGSGDPGESNQLLLISMMIDSYEIEKQENEIELILYKKLLE